MENIVDQDDMGDRHLPDIRDLSDMGDIGDMSDMSELQGDGPLVTFPESDTPPPIGDKPLLSANAGVVGSSAANELKYSAARVTSASSTRVVADGYSALRSKANSARMRSLQHGDLQYAERSAAGASHRLLQAEGLTAEQNAAYLQVSFNHRYCIYAVTLNCIPTYVTRHFINDGVFITYNYYI